MENQAQQGTFKKGLFSKQSIAEKNKVNTSESNSDGILRIDLKKATDDGDYIIKGRLLPNLKRNGELGENSVKRITHFVNVEQGSPLNGYYDCPKNFVSNARSPLGSLQYTLKNSNNVLDKDKAKKISWSQKWYSYFLVYQDKYAPENNGKIFILQYGKQILQKIEDEDKGKNEKEEACVVFDLAEGKDFKLVVYEKVTTQDGRTDKYPDYTKSVFMSSTSPITIFKYVDDEDGKPKREKVTFKVNKDGELSDADQETVFNFLMARTCDLDKFEPKPLSDIQLQNIEQITAILTGKATTSNSADSTDLFNSNSNVNDDFDFDEEPTETKNEQKQENKTESKKDIKKETKTEVVETETVSDDFGMDDDDDDFKF